MVSYFGRVQSPMMTRSGLCDCHQSGSRMSCCETQKTAGMGDFEIRNAKRNLVWDVAALLRPAPRVRGKRLHVVPELRRVALYCVLFRSVLFWLGVAWSQDVRQGRPRGRDPGMLLSNGRGRGTRKVGQDGCRGRCRGEFSRNR